MPGLRPDQIQKIHEYIHAKQMIQAVRFYREITGASLAEAKEAMEEMAVMELTRPPSGTRSYDNPVLESKIRSLLAKRKKIEAIKIYREEYGTGLKEAKDAVDRIEASMPGQRSAISMPHEPAIGSDPFAEDSGANRRRIVVFAAALLVALCALGAFLFVMNF